MKVPWPGDSEGIFRSSSQAATCPPLPYTAETSYCFFNCWTWSREAVNTKFSSFWFNPTGNRTRVYRFSGRRYFHLNSDRFWDYWPVFPNRTAHGNKNLSPGSILSLLETFSAHFRNGIFCRIKRVYSFLICFQTFINLLRHTWLLPLVIQCDLAMSSVRLSFLLGDLHHTNVLKFLLISF